MNKNTSVSLGGHFEGFIQQSIAQGRYKNASEVIRAGLRRLEQDEERFIALKEAIREGIESGPAVEFDPEKLLARIKARHKNG